MLTKPTRALLDRLQLKYPIFLSPMAGIGTPQLAAEVSNAGGLGSLGLGALPALTGQRQIGETRKLTDRPFQINFFCHKSEPLDQNQADRWINYMEPHFKKFSHNPPTTLPKIYQSFLENDDLLKMVLSTKPTGVSFHFGIPLPHQISALQEAGIITMVTATSLIEAKMIEMAGIDIIVAQGVEAGGHRGMFNPSQESAMTTGDLVQLIKRHTTLPIVAAGGIMNGKQAKKLLGIEFLNSCAT